MQTAKENKSYFTADYLKKRARDEDAVNQGSYRMLNVEDDNEVLELGCGPGTAAAVFFEATGSGGLVIGFDCDSKMIRQAKTISKRYLKCCAVGGGCS